MTGSLPAIWHLVKLGQVCELNPRSQATLDAGTPVSFVPMSAVDELLGEIVTAEERPAEEVSRGYTPFTDGDVLFAKITPCMQNGKAAIARNLRNAVGFGSTEFHVLRPKPLVLSEWLFYFLRREPFRQAAAANFTGSAGQQRVPPEFMASALIPLPPLSEQQRVVEILQEAEAVRRLRTDADRKTAELIPAIFHEMFGDPQINERRWATQLLPSLGELDRGRSRHRPRDEPSLYGGPYPFIQTGDVANADGWIPASHTDLLRTWPSPEPYVAGKHALHYNRCQHRRRRDSDV